MKLTQQRIEVLIKEFKDITGVECAFISIDSSVSLDLKREEKPAVGEDMLVGVLFYSTIVEDLVRVVVTRTGLGTKVLMSNALPPTLYSGLPLNDSEVLFHATL